PAQAGHFGARSVSALGLRTSHLLRPLWYIERNQHGWTPCGGSGGVDPIGGTAVDRPAGRRPKPARDDGASANHNPELRRHFGRPSPEQHLWLGPRGRVRSLFGIVAVGHHKNPRSYQTTDFRTFPDLILTLNIEEACTPLL